MGRKLKVATAVAVVAGAIALAGVPLYVMPARDEPRAVDAVYVIGPPTDTRMELAQSLVAEGMASTLVVSLSEEPEDRARYPLAVAACESADPAVVCAMPEPFTTRGEARWLRDLADSHAWESAAVITVTPHITRTRVIMERCWDGDVAYLDSGERLAPHYWAYHYAYQSGAFLKVALEDGC
ncbi:hypothetical protein Lsed01_01988 [Demequina sediminis]|uniref:YdcF family protein n=1 Tax=Demequina sediminis TaxID=1930058 RepID=A0ABP9WI87_9MICO|nr:YdcF family protein [Demequina sediminis]BDZ62056.1 hypothetical protein GCM10025873_18470 [Demequina sediminis]